MKNFFKKIFIFGIVCVFSMQTSFGYSFSNNEIKILNRVYSKIDTIYNKNPKILKNIYPKFKKLKYRYKRKIRFYNLLLEIEKYIGIKLENKSFINNGNNLVNPKNIKKISNEQDKEIKNSIEKNISNSDKKLVKKYKKIIKNNFNNEIKKEFKNVIRTTRKNGVVIKYVKLSNKDKPKHTPKNLDPQIQKEFLISKLTQGNQIVVKYYNKFKFFEITGIEDYSCDSKKLNNYLKNKIENKNIFLYNIKKKNIKVFKAEFYLDGKNLAKVLIENNICK